MSEDVDVVDLEFEPLLNDGKVQARITARRDGQPVVVDRVTVDSGRSRDRFIKRITEKLPDADGEGIEREMLAFADEQAKQPAVTETSEKKEDPLGAFSDETKAEAEAFLENPDLLGELQADFELLGIAGERVVGLVAYLVATSRKLQKPLALIVSGASSSGKSFVIENVVRLMPSEEVDIATDRTLQSLFYKPEDSLRHALVVTKERGAQSEGNLALREMLSAGYVIKDVPVTSELTNVLETKKLRLDGPVAYVETTTQIDTHDEDATRMLQVFSDESEAQTRAVLDVTRMEATEVGLAAGTGRDRVIAKHRCAQLMLDGDLLVTIPYARQIDFPTRAPKCRRLLAHFIGLIKTVALLRQKQKEVREEDGVTFIEADDLDYEIAVGLMEPLVRRALGVTNEKSLDLLQAIRDRVEPDQTFSRSDVRRWTKLSPKDVARRIEPLHGTGLRIVQQGRKGVPWRYKTDTKWQADDDEGELLPWAEVEAAWQSYLAQSDEPATDGELDN